MEREYVLHQRDLMLRAAWLSCAGGLRQAQIAARLGVSRVKVNRMLLSAEREGVIRHTISDVPADCYRLEHELVNRFGLESCRVVPNVEGELPLAALSCTAVKLLQSELSKPSTRSMGIGQGRTLEAVAQALPNKERKHLRFVSLLGCFNRAGAAGPFDVIHTLAAKTKAESYYLPAPLFAESRKHKEMLVNYASVRHILELGRKVDCIFLGLGGIEPNSNILTSGLLPADELAAIKCAGGVGDVLGHFFDVNGKLVDCEANRLAISLDFASLVGHKRVFAVAGGQGKAEAVLGCLRGRLASILVTDEITAGEVVRQDQQSNENIGDCAAVARVS